MLLLFCTQGAFAQTAPAPATPPNSYLGDRFPPGWKELDRAKTLMIGAFPFAYLLSGLGYDINYYIQSGFNPTYTPWPAGPGTESFTGEALQEKYKTLVLSSVIIAGTLALTDFILGLLEPPEYVPPPITEEVPDGQP